MRTQILNVGILGLCAYALAFSCGKKKEEDKFANLALSIKDSTETTHDFGTVASGSKTSATFVITNSGDGVATEITETGLAAPFSFLGGTFPGTGGTCEATLAAGATCELVVEYAPDVTVYTKSAHDDILLVEYKGGTKTSTEIPVKGAGDNCSTQSSVAALANSAGSSNLAWETGNLLSAQSFTPASDMKLTHVTVKLYKGSTASIDSVSLRIRSSGSNNPGDTDTASTSVQGSVITTSAADVDFQFATPVSLTANTTYWFIIDPGTNNITNGDLNTYMYVRGAFSNNWSGGEYRMGQDNSSSWNTWNYDLNFAMKSCAAL